MVDWDKVEVQKLDSRSKEGKIVVSDVKTERSFLLKSLMVFFGVIVTLVLGVLLFQLLTDAPNTDKTVEVLKLVFTAISPILGTLIGYYFGKSGQVSESADFKLQMLCTPYYAMDVAKN